MLKVVKLVIDDYYFQNSDEVFATYETKKVTNIETVANYSYICEEEGYVSYNIINRYQLSLYVAMLNELGLVYRIEDIGNSLLAYKVNLFTTIGQHVRTREDLDRFREFMIEIEAWCEANQNIDNVLDLVSKIGYRRLLQPEKRFLRKYSESL